MLRLCSFLSLFEGRNCIEKRTADLWTLVETGISYLASWAYYGSFDSLVLFWAFWDTCLLERANAVKSLWYIKWKTLLDSLWDSATAVIVCCFIFKILHSFSETSKEVFSKTWWEAKLSGHRAYNSLLYH